MGYSPTEKIINCVLVFLKVLGIYLIGSGISLYVNKFIYGITYTSENELLSILSSHSDPQGLLYRMLGTVHVLTFIIIPYLYIKIFKPDLKNNLRIASPDFLVFLSLAILIFFMAMPSMAYLVDWNKSIHLPKAWKVTEQWIIEKENLAKQLTEIMVQFNSKRDFIAAMLVIAVLPAIGEELLFRGILQNELIQVTRNYHLSIWLAGFLFSFIHFQFFGFFPRLLLGVLFGYLYYWSGNILIPMTIHFLNNGLTLLLMNLYRNRQTEFNPESAESIPLLSVVFSLVLCIYLFNVYRNYYLKHRQELYDEPDTDQ